jgi:hypothetical protein
MRKLRPARWRRAPGRPASDHRVHRLRSRALNQPTHGG